LDLAVLVASKRKRVSSHCTPPQKVRVIFGIADPTMPIHYTTFMAIKGRLLLSVPIVKRFSAKNFL